VAQMRLTDLSVRALKGSADYKRFFDIALPAFGIRVGLRRKTFVIVRGKNRERITIGHYPQMTVAEARTKAKKLLASEPEPKAVALHFNVLLLQCSIDAISPIEHFPNPRVDRR
jgi:hypothetical protein